MDEDEVFTLVMHRSEAENHSDATGRLPVASYRGNNYILVSVYKNYIHAEPMPSREKESYIEAYRKTYQILGGKGHKPNCQKLDNETSQALEDFFANEVKVDWQYVPPSSHRRNKAERAIRTFKNHFISTMASANANFPLYLWDQVLPQILLTINLL
jgi:hypothetical protein